jgi:hypothetical protein
VSEVEVVAGAMWEVWRTSDLADRETWGDLTWNELGRLAGTAPEPNIASRFRDLGFAEAIAAIDALDAYRAKQLMDSLDAQFTRPP